MIEMFVNDNYRLLKLLYDNQSVVLEKKVVPLTQLEISKELGMSKAKVNILFGKLQDEGFILLETRGKYSLTDKATCIVGRIESIEKELNND